jgi:hypothetical protein
MTTRRHRGVRLGFALETGDEVSIPLQHMVITGQTQAAGKTTTLEALVARSGVKALAFLTKRGESAFTEAEIIAPYFRERADWQFVRSILEASRHEKMKFETNWIMRASKGAHTLADVQRNVVRLGAKATSRMDKDLYYVLENYLDVVVPELARVRWAPSIELTGGLNVMDLTSLSEELQQLVIRSAIEWVHEREHGVVIVIPEAWKFIPEGRGTPVKLAAESFIRQGAAIGNLLWLDSQDIAGVEKTILKSCQVWLLGVQREVNEIRRTIAHVPSANRPTTQMIAELELGQFVACWGKHVVPTYVQPAWLLADTARDVAMGNTTIGTARPAQRRAIPRQEEEVNAIKEAKALREENERLRAENERLRRLELATYERDEAERIEAKAPAQDNGRVVERVVEQVGAVDFEDFYQRTKQRLAKEAPAILKTIATKPHLDVEVQLETIEVDGGTTRGRIARLIASRWLDEPKTANAVQSELARLGKDPGPGAAYKEMKALAEMGFLFVERGKDSRSRPVTVYRANEDMIINIHGARGAKAGQ